MTKKCFTFPEVMTALAVVATVCTVFVQAVVIRVRAAGELRRTVELTSLAAERMDAVFYGGEMQMSGMSGDLRWEVNEEAVAPVRGNPLVTMKKMTVVVRDGKSSGGGGEYALSIFKRGA